MIPYVENPPWVDDEGGGTEIDAAALNQIEQGLTDAHLMPAVQVSHNTTNSVANSTAVALECNTEAFDQAGGAASTMHDLVTANSRLVARHAGIYVVQASGITWSASPANAKLEFRDTGSALFGLQQIATDWRVMSGMAFRQLAVNDYVECLVTQFSGGTLTVAAGFEFGMARVA